MPVGKFRPVNYVPYDYSDTGGWGKFRESYDNAKNLAVEAMNQKKGEFMKDEIDRLEMNLLPPADVKMIITDKKTGKQRLNKGFYAIMNKTPEGAYREARKRAEAAGLGKHGLNRQEYMQAWQGMQQDAIKRQYQKLATYGAKNGTTQLQNILEAEGGVFNSFYQRYTDPYIESLGLSNTAQPRRIRKNELGYEVKNRNGVPTVIDIPWKQHFWNDGDKEGWFFENWGLQNEEIVEQDGVTGATNVFGQFIPMGVNKPPK